MNADIDQTEFDWNTPDVVYVAEYYCVEHVTEIIRVFQTLAGDEERYSESDFEEDENLERMLEATGAQEVRQKRVKRKKVRKYIIDVGIALLILHITGFLTGWAWPILYIFLIISAMGQENRKS